MTIKYFHIRVPSIEFIDFLEGKPRCCYQASVPCAKGGATVKVCNRDDDPLYVDVQVAYCSPYDNFSRKAGREVANMVVSKRVPIGSLHRELQAVYDKAMRMSHIPKSARVPRSFLNVAHFFLPKH